MGEDLISWMNAHPGLVRAAGVASVFTFVGSLVLLPLLVARLPADYFARDEAPAGARAHPVLRAALGLGRNLLGGLLVLAGLAMLVLPGQGLLTLLAGLVLSDFPGKRRLELRLVRRPAVLRALNWMRRRAGRPALLPAAPSVTRE